MFKTEVKKALVDYTYDTIRQCEGVVTITFYHSVMDRDKKGMEKALQSLIHKYSIYDIAVRWGISDRGYTYLSVWEDKYTGYVIKPIVKITS